MTSTQVYAKAPKVGLIVLPDNGHRPLSIDCGLSCFQDVESTHRIIEALVEHWTKGIKNLPVVTQQFKDATAAMTAEHEAKTKKVMETVSQQASRLAALEQEAKNEAYTK